MDNKISLRFYILVILLVILTIISIIFVIRVTPTKRESNIALGNVLNLEIKRKGIVIEKIYGVIQFSMSENMFGIKEDGIDNLISRLYSYADNSKIKGIILRINSPGGTIGAVQEVYKAIMYCRSKGKKVVASFGDLAASGGYYIASACDKIVSNPGTITGSIGVIVASPSFVGLFKKLGLGYNVIKSGKHKDILSYYRKMTPEEKRLLQEVVNNSYYQFLKAVSKGRHIKISKLKKIADGRVFTGEQAKRLKLVDELGGLHLAIRLIGNLTGLGNNPHIIRPSVSPITEFLSMINKKESIAESLVKLYNRSTVPVFYLYK